MENKLRIISDNGEENRELFEEMKQWYSRHGYPEKGWGIILNSDSGKMEAERYDELNILPSDDAAIIKAIAKGYQFNNPDNIYEVTNFKEIDEKAEITETENPFHYNSNIVNTYTIFKKGRFFAEVSAGEDDVRLIVLMLNQNKL